MRLPTHLPHTALTWRPANPELSPVPRRWHIYPVIAPPTGCVAPLVNRQRLAQGALSSMDPNQYSRIPGSHTRSTILATVRLLITFYSCGEGFVVADYARMTVHE